MKKGVLWLYSLLCLFTSVANATIDIQLTSESGDYVGAGLSYQYNNSNASITLTPYVNRISTSIYQQSSGENWNLQFKTPQNLSSGAYFNALRYPIQGSFAPGLSVTGNGRGCNQLHGYFVIFELAIVNNALQQFAVDFVQYCDSNTSPLRGSIRLNSAVPVPLDVPVAYAGTDNQVDEASQVTLSAEQSYSALGLPLTYSWSQIMGPAVSLVSPNQATTQFIAPADVNLGGTDLVFNVVVFDSNGASASDNVMIHVRSKSDAKTYLSMHSEVGDYIGQGQDWYYDLNSAQFSLSSKIDNGVSARVTASNTWALDFAPPQGSNLVPGIYSGATRYPFQASNIAGLNVSGYGRGCNTLTGSFQILANASPSGAPASFAASFEQHCEGMTPALTGTLAVNYVDPSVPLADAGADQNVREQDWVTLDGSASHDVDATFLSYQWTQISGPTVLLSGSTSAKATFQAPTLAPGMTLDYLDFELVVTDDQGFKAADQVTVSVQEKLIAPVAKEDEYKVFKNQLSYLDVLANDYDDKQLALDSIVIVSPPSHGRATVRADGIVEYLPDSGYHESDRFYYTVKDSDGQVSNQAKVNIEVLNQSK